MARKDFDKYYNNICNQYNELQEVLKDLSEEVSSGMVEPERIEQLMLTIKPVENNYRTLSYIKYLLDRPTRSAKCAKYNKMSKKLQSISVGHTQGDLEQQNKDIIANLKL